MPGRSHEYGKGWALGVGVVFVLGKAIIDCLFLALACPVNVVGIFLLFLHQLLPMRPLLQGQALPLLADSFREVRGMLLFDGGF